MPPKKDNADGRKKAAASTSTAGPSTESGSSGAAKKPRTERALVFESMWGHYDELLEDASKSDIEKLRAKFIKSLKDHFAKIV